ncbi:MAG: transposase, partial [Gammaproteobacteria bacterium]|nr:transposase [Gammaproteobacteria bacterium]
MGTSNARGERDHWARLRFAVVGPLLASPPPKGRLRAELERLAQQDWEHPCGGGPVRFSASTIERWYYRARATHQDPVRALRTRPRTDAGRVRAMSAALIVALREQYRDHPSWSAQLHHDNLRVRVDADPSLGPMPSYATLTRVMRSLGLVTGEQVGQVYRLRWQVELLFKEWKSYANLHAFETSNASIAEGLIWTAIAASILKRYLGQMTQALRGVEISTRKV